MWCITRRKDATLRQLCKPNVAHGRAPYCGDAGSLPVIGLPVTRLKVCGTSSEMNRLVTRELSTLSCGLCYNVYMVSTEDCWLYAGKLTSQGYARVQNTMAHRAMYEAFLGSIPDGLVIDHLCRVRHCINPLHLEPVTSRVNTLRGSSVKTHCIRGHEFTEENTLYHKRGGRNCRICKNTKLREARMTRLKAASIRF